MERNQDLNTLKLRCKRQLAVNNKFYEGVAITLFVGLIIVELINNYVYHFY